MSLAPGRVTVVLALGAVFACREAPTEALGGLARPDAGPQFPDATLPPVDAGQPPPPDAGIRDSGPIDVGPQCARPTPGGDCACTATAPALGPYQQDDCPAPEDRCVPWDEVSGRLDLRGSFQRCARPCRSNLDCEGRERCTVSGLPRESGASMICVDRVVDLDEVCSGTRARPGEAVTPQGSLLEPGVRVGCRAGLECVLGLGEDFHIDEGACLVRCNADAQCDPATPYCNPNVLTGRDGPTGVCSTAQLGRGGVCGPEQPGRLGITSQCDTSAQTPPNTACFQIPDLLPEGQGICMTVCEAAADCPLQGGVQSECTYFGPDLGICTDPCSSYPQDCPGPGLDGAGRVCMDYLGDDNGESVGFCMDRRRPVLAPAQLAADGTLIEMGDNCFPAAGTGTTDFLRCPEGAGCLIVDFGQGLGLCLFGCDAATAQGNPACTQYVGPASTCTALDVNGPMFGSAGYCATP